MNRLSRAAPGVVVASSITLGAALCMGAPAGAHSGQLYMAAWFDVDPEPRLSTISQSTARIVGLPALLEDRLYPHGLEVFEETAYVMWHHSGDHMGGWLATWDHTSGAVGSPVDIAFELGAIEWLHELDTTTDGTILTLATVEVVDGGIPVEQVWVASIDPVTGELALRVRLPYSPVYWAAIATDPTTGATHVFGDIEGGEVFATIDLDEDTHSEPISLARLTDDLGPGYITAAEFDPSGALWLFCTYYSDEDRPVLVRVAAPVSPEAAAEVIGSIWDQNLQYDNEALAFDPYVAPHLADTGGPVFPFALGATALLAAGALVLAARRRVR